MTSPGSRVSSETEILDVAPIDFLYGLSKKAWKSSFESVAPAKLESETMDMEFHWVHEKGAGSPCILTSGIKLVATVCPLDN